MQHSTDIEIRKALHKKVLSAHHKNSQTIVVDELGLAHGKNRIDIAVLNGCLHGFEIKSSKDNLKRLPTQLAEYTKSLQKLTIVVAPNHLDAVLSIIPDWAGVILADVGPRGAIHFTNLRIATKNPNTCAFSIAHLLWKKEAINYLEYLGMSGNLISNSRKKLYEYIAEMSSVNELILWIKLQFTQREDWRVDLPLLLNDG